MDSNLLVKLGLSRLRLPVPSAKCAVVHSVADALSNHELQDIVWKVLLEWLSEIELESELIEALCIPVLAKHENLVDVGDLQRAIGRPSPLSDIYLREISGSPIFTGVAVLCSDEISFTFITPQLHLKSSRYV